MTEVQIEEEYLDAPMVCAELYQVLGYLAFHFDISDHPDVVKAMDNASQHSLIHKDLLPWPKQDLPITMPRELTDEQADAALRATAVHLDVKGTQLIVNREKMKARYRALVKFIEGQK